MQDSKLLEIIETLLEESPGFFPDDDSKREGYQFALIEIIELIKETPSNAIRS